MAGPALSGAAGPRDEARPAERDAPAPASARTSPYKGLTPFAASDAEYFFGRESDCEIIAANLMAARLTVLYGESGVGKSSLLQAGLCRRLEELAERNRDEHGAPELVAVVFRNWRDDDVVTAVRQTVFDAVARLTGSAPQATGSLADDLEACSDAVGGEVLLMLDQFEEYFLYHPCAGGEGSFDAELAAALARPDLQTNILISIREDALAGLDRFKGRVAHLFDNYLRVHHLDRESARATIEKPVARFNADRAGTGPAIEIEPELVERILDEVRAGQAVLEDGGRGSPEALRSADPQDERVETPYLQLVLARLWHEERREGSHVMRSATLERLGGAVQMVRTHLADSLAHLSPEERDLAARTFNYLVTPSGTKVAHAPADLANYAGVDEHDLVDLLERLSHGSARILRPVADETGRGGGVHYEIFHDVLAAPILDWRRRHVADALALESDARRRDAERRHAAQQRRARMFRAWAIASAACAAVAGVATLLAVRAGHEARAQKLMARAVSELPLDPVRGVRLADQALDARASVEAERTLREALDESRLSAVLEGHDGAVLTAAYSGDGARILTAGADGSARLWTAGGDPLGPPMRGHGAGQLSDALFGAGGRRIVTSGLDGKVRIWDAATRRRLRVLDPGAGPLYAGSVASSDDGRYVLTPGADQTVVIWDADTGAALPDPLRGASGNITAVAISRDGARVAAGSEDTLVYVWDARRGGPPLAFFANDAGTAVTSVEFSPDRSRVLVGTGEQAYLFTIGGRELALRSAFDFGLVAAHFSPDANMIVTAGDRTAQLHDPTTGDPTAALRTRDYVTSARFSPDGQLVVTGAQDGVASVWSVGGERLAELRGHTDSVWDASFSADGSRVVTASADGTARVWSMAAIGSVLHGHRREVTSATFSPDGRHVLTASHDGTARVWNAATGKVSRTVGDPDPQPAPLNSAARSDDGDVIVTGGLDSTVRVYDGTRAEEPIPLPGPVFDVSLDRAGRRLLSAGGRFEGFAQISDLRGRHRVELVGHEREVTAARFDPREKRVATASVDRSARIFRASDGKLLQTLGGRSETGHAGPVWSVRWSDDGRFVVTAGSDRTVRVWDAADGTLVKVLDGLRGAASNALFANGDRWLVAASSDGFVRIWDTETWRPLAVMRRHQAPINALAVSAGNTILTAGVDASARLYRCTTCVSLPRLRELAADHLAKAR